jgi:hypothetical protein
MLQAAFYKGTQTGMAGVYNRLVRAFESGPYSHCELVFNNGDSASATFMHGGVRFTGPGHKVPRINFANGNWDLIQLPDHLHDDAVRYFVAREGWSYDLRGNVRFVWPWGNRDSKLKEFCIEAVLGALGVPEPWRFGVNAGAAVCRRLAMPAGQ